MKDTRFIELLNLYVDQEISADEAAELEQEIANNPARRRTYDQYCQMHRGCAMLFESTRAQAPRHPKLVQAAAAADEQERVLAFPAQARARRPVWPRLAWAGGLAAALTVGALQGPAIVAALRAPAAPVAAQVARATSATTRIETLPKLAPMESSYQVVGLLNRGADRTLVFQTVSTEVPSWENRMELAPLGRISVENLRLTNDVSNPAERTFAGSQPFATPHSAVELSAFQFQK